jgi:hypothetical protein
MATDQELTIIDVIHASLGRVPKANAITIVSGVYCEFCAESGVDRKKALELIKQRYDSCFELFKQEE